MLNERRPAILPQANSAAYSAASKIINAALKKLRKKSDKATGSISIGYHRWVSFKVFFKCSFTASVSAINIYFKCSFNED